MNRQIALQSPVQIFIQKKTHLGRKQCMLPRFFKESDDLLALYAGKSLEKLLDRIARFQMIEKTLHWDASSSKNGLSAKNLRVLRYNAAHDYQNTVSARLSQNRSSSAINSPQ
jgi:hypothetical protein